MASANAIITDVLYELRNRKGFDALWDEIDEDIQDEIEAKLTQIADEHLDGHKPEDRADNTIKSVTIVRKGDSKKLFNAYGETEAGYKVRLPIMGIRHEENFREHGVVYLGFGSHRTTYQDID